MELEGCSNPGLSYTKKYIQSIIAIYDFVCTNSKDRDYSYVDFQKILSSNSMSDESEIRMLIPFMLKTGILNEDNITRGGSRIKKILLNNKLFSYEGKNFVKFLKIIQKYEMYGIKKNALIDSIYQKFGLIQFDYLRRSNDYIYNDIYVFLLKYNSIDKNEFFILTDCRKKDRMQYLDKIINDYRNNKLEKIKIINNVNSFQYISQFLIQIGILIKTENKLELNSLAKTIMQEGENNEFRS